MKALTEFKQSVTNVKHNESFEKDYSRELNRTREVDNQERSVLVEENNYATNKSYDFSRINKSKMLF